MKDNAPQLEKAALPTLVHAGRLTDVSILQPIKAPASTMDACEMLILLRLVH